MESASCLDEYGNGDDLIEFLNTFQGVVLERVEGFVGEVEVVVRRIDVYVEMLEGGEVIFFPALRVTEAVDRDVGSVALRFKGCQKIRINTGIVFYRKRRGFLFGFNGLGDEAKDRLGE